MDHFSESSCLPQSENRDKYCLVAEDNYFAMDIMKIFLQKQGLAVETAENGKIALEKYVSAPSRYSIIFMDLQMPVMSGYEAVERIRSSGYDGAGDIPIIAMSGDPLLDVFEYGFNDCLRKPFEMKTVLPVLQDYLKD